MHLLRTAPLITLTLACLAVPATTAATAATMPHHAPAAAQLTPAFTHLVFYKGGNVAEPVPKTPLTLESGWQLSKSPGEIVTTNDGTMKLDPALNAGPCAPFTGLCSEWRYSKSGVELLTFSWEKPNGGGTVTAIQLDGLLNNNYAWFHVSGGTYAPKCLSFVDPSTNQPDFIQMNKKGGTWSKVKAGAVACPPPAPATRK
jgi:hypothetical protein